jgi:hypothetical protein
MFLLVNYTVSKEQININISTNSHTPALYFWKEASVSHNLFFCFNFFCNDDLCSVPWIWVPLLPLLPHHGPGVQGPPLTQVRAFYRETKRKVRSFFW